MHWRNTTDIKALFQISDQDNIPAHAIAGLAPANNAFRQGGEPFAAEGRGAEEGVEIRHRQHDPIAVLRFVHAVELHQCGQRRFRHALRREGAELFQFTG